MPNYTKAGYIPPEPPKVPREKKKKPAKENGKGRKRKRLSGAMIAALIVLAAAIIASAGIIYMFVQTDTYQLTFAPGTYLAEYPMAGLSRGAAEEYLAQLAGNSADAWHFDILWEDKTWTLTASDVSLEVDTAQTLDPLWAVGRDGNMLERFIAIQKARLDPVKTQPVVRYDLAAADALLEEIRGTIDRACADAQVSYDPGSAEPFVYTDEVVGLTVDLSELRGKIEKALSNLSGGSVTLEPEENKPEITRAMLEEKLSLRARVTMTLPKDTDVQTNIVLAASLLDGVRLESGSRLSFNELVGSRTAEGGYVSAPEEAYGAGVSGMGGGICFVSSALYHAGLLAMLDIPEHHAAVRPVSYCEAGLEAAVSGQGLDLVLENNTALPLFFASRVYDSGEERVLELRIYGEAMPVRTVLEAKSEETLRIEEPIYIRDRSGEHAVYNDERVPGNDGMPEITANITRVLISREDGSESERQQLGQVVYEAVAPTIYIGVQQR